MQTHNQTQTQAQECRIQITHPTYTHTHTETDDCWHSFRCLVFCCVASIVGSHVCQPFSQRSICSNRIHTLWPRLTFVVSHVRNDFVSVWPSHTAPLKPLALPRTLSALCSVLFGSVWFCFSSVVFLFNWKTLPTFWCTRKIPKAIVYKRVSEQPNQSVWSGLKAIPSGL